MDRIACSAGALLLAAVPLLGHSTWIAVVPHPLVVGKAAKVQIGNGHQFPLSESAMGVDGLQMFAVAPSGARTTLQPHKEAAFVRSDYTVREAGLHRFAFVQDRGIVSRTPQGLRPGGRDKNPKALQALKMYRSAVAYSGTADKPKPLGLTFELLGACSRDSLILTLLLNSKPLQGVGIGIVWPGGKEEKLGATGIDGTFTYRIPAGTKGPLLLEATHTENAPAGSPYDTSSYSTALYLEQ